MSDGDETPEAEALETELDAGPFSSWLRMMDAALAGERGSDVPCGGCTACCTSSQFIHIGPDETDTLAQIPGELLFPAPGLPRGHVLLGHDERGHCPMLVDERCTIYAHRPTTCRTYDCRVLPAAGIEADDDQPEIARRASRWRFDHPTPSDRVEHDAVRAAATFLRDDPEVRAMGTPRATQLAVLAVEVHDLFLTRDQGRCAVSAVAPEAAEVRVEVRRRLAR